MTDEPNVPDLEVHDGVPSGLKVTTDRPYRVLFFGCLAGTGDNASLSGPLNEGVTKLNAENFDKVMAEASPRVNFTLADPTTQSGAMVEVDLAFASIKAFAPTALAERIPAVKALMDIRAKLVDRLKGRLDRDGLDREVSSAVSGSGNLAWLSNSLAWKPKSPGVSDADVDAVLASLDLDDGEDTPAPPAKSEIGKLVSSAADDGSSIPSEEASAIRHTVAEIDRRCHAWLNTVLHHPAVQSVEACWRSLSYIVTHTEFRKGLRLDVLHAAPAERMEVFVAKLIDPVFDEGHAAPDLVVVDGQFGQTAADIEVLDELAQHAASLPSVAIAGVSAGFFGVKHAWQMSTLATIPNLFDQWQFAKWKSLRNEGYARHLAVVFGRCLLRSPYTRESDADLAYSFREETVGERDFVWGSGVIVPAVTIMRSVAESRWPTSMSGMVFGRVDGFQKGMGGKRGDKEFGPTDTQLDQNKIEEMGAVGVSATVGLSDREDVLFWNAMTAARPASYEPAGLLEVSLPYRLFACRISALLFELKPHLERQSAPAVEKMVRAHVNDWLGISGDDAEEAVKVQTRDAEDGHGIDLAVTVTPTQQILPGEVPVVMGYRLGG